MSPGTSCPPSVVEQRHEAQVHTYTPLFAPPTPPASPTPPTSRAAVKLDADSKARSRNGQRSLQASNPSALDIGFVAVLAEEDPLSLLASTSTSNSSTSQVDRLNEVTTQPNSFTPSRHHAGEINGQLGLDPYHYDNFHEHCDENSNNRPPKQIHLDSSSSNIISNTSCSKSDTGTNPSVTNSTLAFFDKFVHEAKAASESKRRSLLDEILLHQDNPLFRWARQGTEGEAEGVDGDKDAGEADRDHEALRLAHAGRDGGTDCDGDEDGDSVGMDEDKNSSADLVRHAHGSGEDGEEREESDTDTRGRVQDALVTLLVDPKSFKNPGSRIDPGHSSSHQYSSPPSSFQAPESSPPRSRRRHTRRPSIATSRTSSASISSTSSPRHSPTLTAPSLAPPLLTEAMDSLFSMEGEDDQDIPEEEGDRDQNRGSRFRQRRPQSQGPASSQVLDQETSEISTSPYSTLSGIPARWMSSLSSSLSRSNTPNTSPAKGRSKSSVGATPSLESIFAASSSAPMYSAESTRKAKRTTAPSASSSDLLEQESGSGVSTPVPMTQSHGDGAGASAVHHAGSHGTADAQIARKGHAQTPIQIPSSRRSRPSTSHGPTPGSHVRAASITHETPFGSHVFTSISGAPGFMGERYDWDKGFSNGLMKEMRESVMDGNESGRGSSAERDSDVDRREGRDVTGSGNGNGSVRIKGKRESVVKRIRGKIEEKIGTTKEARSVDVTKSSGMDKENEGAPVKLEGKVGLGEFMEKKSGSIELGGRKEATTPVLEVRLADMVSAKGINSPQTSLYSVVYLVLVRFPVISVIHRHNLPKTGMLTYLLRSSDRNLVRLTVSRGRGILFILWINMGYRSIHSTICVKHIRRRKRKHKPSLVCFAGLAD